MANVINATSAGNGGLVSTGDDSGVLNIQTNETTAATIDASQNVSFTNGVNMPNTFGFKNRLINAGMAIDQRNSGASVSYGSGTSVVYTLDRWQIVKTNDATEAIVQSTDAPTGFRYSLRNTVSAADTSIGATQFSGFKQTIEGFNVADLMYGTASAKTVTVSFWVRATVTGQYTGNLSNGDGSRLCPFAFTINASNTWEYKSVTLPGCTDGTWSYTNGSGLALQVYCALGSSYSGGTAGVWNSSNGFGCGTPVNNLATIGNIFAITGVQLEAGTQATSFDFRSYGTELALCQRYYQKIGNASYTGIGTGLINSLRTGSNVVVRSVVDLRTVPTVNYSNIISTDRIGYDADITSISGTAAGVNGTYITFGHTASGTAVQPTLIVSKNGTTGYVSFDAEL
jgi:hypothetical protein